MRESYAKETKKSKPVAIRYNLEEFEIAKTNSGKQTVQSLFDFLLNKYVNGILLPPPAQMYSPAAPFAFTPAKELVISSYDAYRGDIDRSESIEAIKAIDKEVQRDYELTNQQKEALKQIGIEKSKTLDF